jgi:hypothetical protein
MTDLISREAALQFADDKLARAVTYAAEAKDLGAPVELRRSWKAVIAHLSEVPEAIRALPAIDPMQDPRVVALVEAAKRLHHAVCGETGFAQCVREDSGRAYPWPALDEADDLFRATLAEIKGESHD